MGTAIAKEGSRAGEGFTSAALPRLRFAPARLYAATVLRCKYRFDTLRHDESAFLNCGKTDFVIFHLISDGYDER